jgi:hypothetical protein
LTLINSFDECSLQVIESANGYKAIHALIGFYPGSIVINFGIAALLGEPTRFTIQCGISEHMLVTPNLVQFINHSCDPNVVLDTKKMNIRAIGGIEPGDEIVYFYPSTEWSMAEPFRCHCNSHLCLSQIRGAAYIEPDVIAKYYLSDHIAMLLAKQRAALPLNASRLQSPVGARRLVIGTRKGGRPLTR